MYKYVFIKVREFDDVPIICKKSSGEELKTGYLYIRTVNANSVPITAPGINNVEEMRNLVDLAITKRSDRLLEQIRKLVQKEPITEKVGFDNNYKKEYTEVKKDF